VFRKAGLEILTACRTSVAVKTDDGDKPIPLTIEGNIRGMNEEVFLIRSKVQAFLNIYLPDLHTRKGAEHFTPRP
jgi:hypothetical protein